MARGRMEQNLRAELLEGGFNIVEGDEVERAPTPRDPEADRLWLLTSGSTGRPKRIGHTLRSLTTVSGEMAPRRWLCPYSPGTYAWWQVVTLGLGSPGRTSSWSTLRTSRAGSPPASSTASPRPRARRPSGARRS